MDKLTQAVDKLTGTMRCTNCGCALPKLNHDLIKYCFSLIGIYCRGCGKNVSDRYNEEK